MIHNLGELTNKENRKFQQIIRQELNSFSTLISALIKSLLHSEMSNKDFEKHFQSYITENIALR